MQELLRVEDPLLPVFRLLRAFVLAEAEVGGNAEATPVTPDAGTDKKKN